MNVIDLILGMELILSKCITVDILYSLFFIEKFRIHNSIKAFQFHCQPLSKLNYLVC